MIRYAIYLFMFLSFVNIGERLITKDWTHVAVGAVLVFMSLTAFMLTLDD